MSFPAFEEWKIPDELTASVGRFVLNVVHLEYELGRTAAVLLGANMEGWFAVHGKTTFGRGWDVCRVLLKRSGVDSGQLTELNKRMRGLIEFRNLLVHGAWISVREELREYHVVPPEPGKERRVVSIKDVDEQTKEAVALFKVLYAMFFSLPEEVRRGNSSERAS